MFGESKNTTSGGEILRGPVPQSGNVFRSSERERFEFHLRIFTTRSSNEERFSFLDSGTFFVPETVPDRADFPPLRGIAFELLAMPRWNAEFLQEGLRGSAIYCES